MAHILDFVFIFILVFYSFLKLIVDFKKYNLKWDKLRSLIFLQNIFVFIFALLGLLSMYQNYLWFIFDKYDRVILMFLHTILLYQISFVAVRELSQKKIATLWRLPLLGALFGILDLELQLYLHLGLFILIAYIYYLNHKYLAMMSLIAIQSGIVTIASLWLEYFGLWYLCLLLMFIMGASSRYWNLLYCKFETLKEMEL